MHKEREISIGEKCNQNQNKCESQYFILLLVLHTLPLAYDHLNKDAKIKSWIETRHIK